jgi:hypothetical protein
MQQEDIVLPLLLSDKPCDSALSATFNLKPPVGFTSISQPLEMIELSLCIRHINNARLTQGDAFALQRNL